MINERIVVIGAGINNLTKQKHAPGLGACFCERRVTNLHWFGGRVPLPNANFIILSYQILAIGKKYYIRMSSVTQKKPRACTRGFFGCLERRDS